MTTKDTPNVHRVTIARAWLGTAYADAWFSGFPLPTPTNPVPNRLTNPDPDTTRWEWDVNLTAAQATAFDDLVKAVKAGMDPALYATIKDDVTGLLAYQNLANPTLAQTVAATKAHSRILKVLLRD